MDQNLQMDKEVKIFLQLNQEDDQTKYLNDRIIELKKFTEQYFQILSHFSQNSQTDQDQQQIQNNMNVGNNKIFNNIKQRIDIICNCVESTSHLMFKPYLQCIEDDYIKYIDIYIKNDHTRLNKIIDEDLVFSQITQIYKEFLKFVYIFSIPYGFYNVGKHSDADQYLQKRAIQKFRQFYWSQGRDSHWKIFTKQMFQYLRIQNIQINKEELRIYVKLIEDLGFNYFQNAPVIVKNATGQIEAIVDEENSNEGYIRNFENPFMEEFKIYYDNVLRDLVKLSRQEFIEDIEKIFKNEDKWGTQFYNRSSQKILKHIEDVLLIQNIELVIEKIFQPAIQNNEPETIKRMLKLYKRSNDTRSASFNNFGKIFATYVSDSLNQIEEQFKNYVKEEEKKLQDESKLKEQSKTKKTGLDLRQKAIKYLNMIVEFKDKEIMHSYKDQDDGKIQSNINSAYFHFFHDQSRQHFSDQLVIFIDEFALNTNKYQILDHEKQINDFAQIFCWISDKVFFLKRYKNQLSKRLLNHRSKMDEQYEKNIITEFKNISGNQSLKEIEKLFSDIQNSDEIQKQIVLKIQQENTQIQDQNQIIQTELKSVFISQSEWDHQVKNCKGLLKSENVSKDVEQLIQIQKESYQEMYNQREAELLYTEGNAQLKFKGRGNQNYTLEVNTIQMIIIMKLAEAKQEISIKDLDEGFGIEKELFEQALNSLIKHEIVLKNQEKEDTSAEKQNLRLNGDFRNKNRKINCKPKGKAVKLDEDKKRIQSLKLESEQVARLHMHIIESVVVRIMKSKRQMKMRELIRDTIDQIKNFQPSHKDIKPHIESLIDRNFIKRGEDINTLTYVP